MNMKTVGAVAVATLIVLLVDSYTGFSSSLAV